jgi:hypothetical protein
MPALPAASQDAPSFATGSCTIYEEIDPRKVFEALAEAG